MRRGIKMSILKFENRTPKDLNSMVAYLTNESKTTAEGIFGIGIDPADAVNQMRFVHNVYGYRELSHEYLQIIFCFDVGVNLNIWQLREICEKIAWVLITDERQVFGAIHYLNTEKIHCHYLINYVGINGSLYNQNYSVIHYKKMVNEILKLYGLSEVYFYSNKFCNGSDKID